MKSRVCEENLKEIKEEFSSTATVGTADRGRFPEISVLGDADITPAQMIAIVILSLREGQKGINVEKEEERYGDIRSRNRLFGEGFIVRCSGVF